MGPGPRTRLRSSRPADVPKGAGPRSAAPPRALPAVGAAALLAVALAAPPGPAGAQEEAGPHSAGRDPGRPAPRAGQAAGFPGCPGELDGPQGAAGVAWGDTVAAARALAEGAGARGRAAGGVDSLLRRGDRAVRAGHHTLAYAAYTAAARAGGGYGALWKAARAAVDVGQDAGEEAEAWYRRAQEVARRAVEAEPGAPEGHLQLAQALGLVALDAGVRERVRLSEEIRKEARAAIEADSAYAGGWHVLGRWNKGVMELSGFGRMFARTFLGGEVLGEASWEKAESFLEKAAELEPDRLVHHLELGKVYRQREKPAEARAALQRALSLSPRDYHDCVYQAEARSLLQEVEGGG